MSVDIQTEQNSNRSIKLLSAQRQLYTEAKRLHFARLLGSILLAVVAPFITVFQPGWSAALGAFGGFWLLLDQAVLKHLQSARVKMAATIQEEFDVSVFNLPWGLVEDRIAPELISRADHRFKGDREKLKNWYPDMGAIPYPLNVLICQRFNLVWDWQLRRGFATAILILIAAYLALLTWLSISRNLLLIEAILLFLPAATAIAEGISMAIEHFQLASDKEKTSQKMLGMWEKGIEGISPVTIEDCRNIQDCIYGYRLTGAFVPNWWYNWLRERYEVNMYGTAEDMKTKAERMLNS